MFSAEVLMMNVRSPEEEVLVRERCVGLGDRCVGLGAGVLVWGTGGRSGGQVCRSRLYFPLSRRFSLQMNSTG